MSEDSWRYTNSEDALRLNYYTYCANNPIYYIDPSGLYYIVKNQKYNGPASDPLLESFTGTYTVVKQSYMNSIVRGIVSFIPYIGNEIAGYALDSSIRGVVVGGTSTIGYESEWYRSYVESGAYDYVSTIMWGVIPIGEIANIIVEAVNDIGNLFHYLDISLYDKVYFQLISFLGLPTTFATQAAAERQMGILHSLVSYNVAYYTNTIVNGKTSFEIDMMLKNASNPDQWKIIASYSRSFAALDHIDFYEQRYNSMYNYLWGFHERLDAVRRAYEQY